MKLFTVVIVVIAISAIHFTESTDNVSIEDAERFLAKFDGYEIPKTSGNEIRIHPSKDPKFIEALKKMQKYAGIKQTGVLDEATMKKMKQKRCGLPDEIIDKTNSRKKRYALSYTKWSKTHLTYEIAEDKYTSDISREEVDRIIEKALKYWSDVSKLTFERIRGGNQYTVDIYISFSKGEHSDGNPFDGPGGVLAHAYFPTRYSTLGGDVHFDDDEKFDMGSLNHENVFLLQVATHELGHSLGLGHSMDYNAMMYSYYPGYQSNLKLGSDDIQGIQYLYGKNVMRLTTSTMGTTRSIILGDKSSTTTEKEQRTTTTDTPRRTEKLTTTTTSTTTTTTTTTIKPTEALDIPNLCKNAKLDAIVKSSSGYYYVFQGEYCWKMSENGIIYSKPRKISKVFRGLPSHIDSGFYWEYTRSTYFFKDQYYYKFRNEILSYGYPKRINIDGFFGIPLNTDSAFVYQGNGLLYFTKGEDYYRYEYYEVPYWYPQKISSVWVGLPNQIDASFSYSNGYNYFFSGQYYYRFNPRTFRVDASYPRNTGEWWFGCSNNIIKPESSIELDRNSTVLNVGENKAENMETNKDMSQNRDIDGSQLNGNGVGKINISITFVLISIIISLNHC